MYPSPVNWRPIQEAGGTVAHMSDGSEVRLLSLRLLWRRSAGLGLAGLGIQLLAACSPAAPAPAPATTAPAAPAAAAPATVAAHPRGVALGKLPTFMPVQAQAPDLPGTPDGLVSPGYIKYPATLF